MTAFCSSSVPNLVQSAKASTVSLFIYQKSSKVLKEGSRRVFNNNNPQAGIWVWVHRAKFLCPRNLWKAVRVCNNNNNTTSTGKSRVHVDQSREAPLQSHACEISSSTRVVCTWVTNTKINISTCQVPRAVSHTTAKSCVILTSKIYSPSKLLFSRTRVVRTDTRDTTPFGGGKWLHSLPHYTVHPLGDLTYT